MALHSLPHFRSLMFPPGSFLLRYPTRPPEPEGAWFPKPSASASAGPAGCTERAVPGNPRSAPPPHVPGAVAASAGHEGKTPQQAPPDSPTSRPGPWTRTPHAQLTARPEAGRRKAPLSRPAHRSAPAWIRPEEVEGPVSGCAIAAWVSGPRLPGRQAGGAGRGWGFRGAAGRAARGRGPGWLVARGPSAAPPAGVGGGLRPPGTGPGPLRARSFCPPGQPGNCWSQSVEGPGG